MHQKLQIMHRSIITTNIQRFMWKPEKKKPREREREMLL